MNIIKTILFETDFEDEKKITRTYSRDFQFVVGWYPIQKIDNEAMLFCSSASSMVVKKLASQTFRKMQQQF